ncbi:GNAT family N-acetyltransferase [Undibacterium crateris]|uniref:GNAT family N-acetyltransferase n=1 Tax=Undibacterium crateris TaxID=2528175 RepID=UPI001F2CCE64|nr:GNAT family N-acetyltransferase [Undibacterium crateris]
MQIRIAITADLPAIQTLFSQALRDADWLPSAARQADDFAAVSVGERILISELEPGVPAGFLSYQPEHAFIHHLYVAQHAQGRGVGRSLLHALHAHLACPWHLKCVVNNHAAYAFYLRMGWTVVQRAASEHGDYYLLKLAAPDVPGIPEVPVGAIQQDSSNPV